MLSCACSGIVYRWRQNVITDVLDPLTPKIRLLTHLTFFFNDANTKQQKKNFCWCWRYLCVFPQKMTWLRTNLKSCKFVYNSAYHMSMTVFTWSKWTFYYDYYDYYYYYYYYYFHYCSFIIKTKYGCESDLRNNEHYLSSSENNAWKKVQSCAGFEPMTSAKP